MADETKTQQNDESNQYPPTNQPEAAGADKGADAVGNVDPAAADPQPNDGSNPMPRHGELEQAVTNAEPRATADERQTAAGTGDTRAVRAGRDGQGGRGGRDGGRGRGRGRDRGRGEESDDGIESSVIRIYRCSKVVKGGRTFSFAALVVAGDRAGKIGFGYGKANEVPSAVEKATKEARRNMRQFAMKGSTIPHQVTGRSGSSSVRLIPARPGTGVTAGKSVRPALELAGLSDILTKAYGSTSPKNLIKATVNALYQLQNREDVQSARGVELEKSERDLVAAE